MAFDAYIKFLEPPVNGEATLGDTYEPDGPKKSQINWIEMTEYGLSFTMAVSPARSSGTGAATTGKGKLEPLTFKKSVDATSMHLAFHAAAGTIFKTIVINLFAALGDGGGKALKPHQFLTIVMQGAVINSCKLSGGGGDELPTEEISVSYGVLEYKYKNFDVDATTGAISPGKKQGSVSWNTISNSGTKA